MLYGYLVCSLLFILAIPGFLFNRLFLHSRVPQGAELALVIGVSLFTTHILIVVSTAIAIPAFWAMLILSAAAGSIVVFDCLPRSINAPRSSYSSKSLLLGLAGLVLLLGLFWFYWVSTPAVFAGSDPLSTWNPWAELWSIGEFPKHSYRYPQLAATTWGATYIWLSENIHFGPTYLFILLLTLPPVAAIVWVGDRHAFSAFALTGTYGLFVAHFGGWLRGTILASFPDWIVVSLVSTATILVAPWLFARNSDLQAQAPWLLAVAQVYLCCAASIKPLAAILAVSLLATTAVFWLRTKDVRMRRSMLWQVLVIILAIAAYVVYLVHVTNTVDLPQPRSSGPLHQTWSAARFLWSSTNPLFVFLSIGGLALLLTSKRSYPLGIGIGLGFVVWAHTAAYDLRNVLPYLAASALFCAFFLTEFSHRFLPSRFESEVFLRTANRRLRLPSLNLLAYFAAFLAVVTLPLALPNDKFRLRFIEKSRASGLGSSVNGYGIEASKRGCWIGTNNPQLYAQNELVDRRGHMTWLAPSGNTKDSFTRILTEKCAMVVVSEQSVDHSAMSFFRQQHSLGDYDLTLTEGWIVLRPMRLPIS